MTSSRYRRPVAASCRRNRFLIVASGSAREKSVIHGSAGIRSRAPPTARSGVQGIEHAARSAPVEEGKRLQPSSGRRLCARRFRSGSSAAFALRADAMDIVEEGTPRAAPSAGGDTPGHSGASSRHALQQVQCLRVSRQHLPPSCRADISPCAWPGRRPDVPETPALQGFQCRRQLRPSPSTRTRSGTLWKESSPAPSRLTAALPTAAVCRSLARRRSSTSSIMATSFCPRTP